jgi:hypothetical protein
VKIGLVAPHFPPEARGGVESLVEAQAEAHAEGGHEVLVVAGNDAREDSRETRQLSCGSFQPDGPTTSRECLHK